MSEELKVYRINYVCEFSRIIRAKDRMDAFRKSRNWHAFEEHESGFDTLVSNTEDHVEENPELTDSEKTDLEEWDYFQGNVSDDE